MAKSMQELTDAANLRMYRRAWVRELEAFGFIPKSHEIDSLVLTTRKLKSSVRRECAKEMLKTVTRIDMVALADRWKKEIDNP